MNTQLTALDSVFPMPRLDVLRGELIFVARVGAKPRYRSMWSAMEYERGYLAWPNLLSQPAQESVDGYTQKAKEVANEMWMQTNSEAQA